jgi:hypothetical protein
MIHVVLYFWNHLNVCIAMGITCSPLPYLVSFHLSRFTIQTYVKHNPFGTISSKSRNNFYYNMLFKYYNDSCDPIYCTKSKLKKSYNIFIINFSMSI